MLLLRLLRSTGRAAGVLMTELFPFLGAGRARSLPPLPAMIAVIGAGLLIPLVMRVEARSGSMTASLATQRLVRFQQEAPAEFAEVSPAGTLLWDQPLFRWPALDGAARYGFRLYAISSSGEETLWIGSDVLREAGYRLLSPARLEGGLGAPRAYRFEVRAYDADGRTLRWPGDRDRLEGAFDRIEMEEADQDSLRTLRRDLPSHEAAFVAAGICAEKGSAYDVVAALDAYLQLEGGDEASRALARDVLERLGWR